MSSPLEIHYPNGAVQAGIVFVWDPITLQPILWDGSVDVDSLTIGTVNQGNPGAIPWPVTNSNVDITLSSFRDAILRMRGMPLLPEYDEFSLGYTGSNVTSITFKRSSIVVATLTLTWSGDSLINVVQS